MGFRIREMHTEGKFSRALTVEALSRAIPQEAIRRAVQLTVGGKARERKVSLPVVVWLVIALHVYHAVDQCRLANWHAGCDCSGLIR
jgi:hypothetical protein